MALRELTIPKKTIPFRRLYGAWLGYAYGNAVDGYYDPLILSENRPIVYLKDDPCIGSTLKGWEVGTDRDEVRMELVLDDLFKLRPDHFVPIGMGIGLGWAVHGASELFDLSRYSRILSSGDAFKLVQCIALMIYLGRCGCPLQKSISHLSKLYNYPVSSLENFRLHKDYLLTPPRIGARLMSVLAESKDFSDALTKARLLGGATAHICMLVGAVAESYFAPMPSQISSCRLPPLSLPLIKVQLPIFFWMMLKTNLRLK